MEHVRRVFGLQLASTSRVVGGEDPEALVLRALTHDGASLALKVSARSGVGGLLVADLLASHGIQGVPAPLRTRSGQPWSTFGPDRVSLTSWIRGSRGMDAPMTDSQWRSFGALLAQVHTVDVPASVQAELPREDHTTVASATVV